MKALLLTNEYPPNVYGGAGVHVDYLSRELAKLIPVEVRCFGDQANAECGVRGAGEKQGELKVKGFQVDITRFTCPPSLNSVFGALQRCLDFNTTQMDASIVHCHTWYSHWGGILAKLNYGIPLVITVHSLEPLRPWKREQLGNGYDFTLWLEKTALEMADAVIAVSKETKADILRLFDIPEERIRVIYNGIDLEEYRYTDSKGVLKRFGIDEAKPYALFIGRIARQKGIIHLVNAIRYFDPGFQVVLCAGAPDTPEIADEMKQAVSQAQAHRDGIIWIDQTVNTKEKIELYSHASVFICPSIYEPFGIINLEAMACKTAVVGSAVGGIPEVVIDGVTGYLVPINQMKESPFEPLDPDQFARDLAARVNKIIADPQKQVAMANAGRDRVEQIFGWPEIARETVSLYKELIKT